MRAVAEEDDGMLVLETCSSTDEPHLRIGQPDGKVRRCSQDISKQQASFLGYDLCYLTLAPSSEASQRRSSERLSTGFPIPQAVQFGDKRVNLGDHWYGAGLGDDRVADPSSASHVPNR